MVKRAKLTTPPEQAAEAPAPAAKVKTSKAPAAKKAAAPKSSAKKLVTRDELLAMSWPNASTGEAAIKRMKIDGKIDDLILVPSDDERVGFVLIVKPSPEGTDKPVTGDAGSDTGSDTGSDKDDTEADDKAPDETPASTFKSNLPPEAVTDWLSFQHGSSKEPGTHYMRLPIPATLDIARAAAAHWATRLRTVVEVMNIETGAVTDTFNGRDSKPTIVREDTETQRKRRKLLVRDNDAPKTNGSVVRQVRDGYDDAISEATKMAQNAKGVLRSALNKKFPDFTDLNWKVLIMRKGRRVGLVFESERKEEGPWYRLNKQA